MTPFIYKTQEFNWIPSPNIKSMKFSITPKPASSITISFSFLYWEIGFIKLK